MKIRPVGADVLCGKTDRQTLRNYLSLVEVLRKPQKIGITDVQTRTFLL